MSATKQIQVGNRFGRLVVVCRNGSSASGNAKWLCNCDCGQTCSPTGTRLRRGDATSCGCMATTALAEANRQRSTHRMTDTAEYRCWRLMRYRCCDPDHAQYGDYGGRGIRVCTRWESFEAFLADMGNRPSKDHSLDRIDNDGNYMPENCRWATQHEQHNNKRSNVWLHFDGLNLTIAQVARRIGSPYSTIYARYQRGEYREA